MPIDQNRNRVVLEGRRVRVAASAIADNRTGVVAGVAVVVEGGDETS